jgi:hypothetical protein
MVQISNFYDKLGTRLVKLALPRVQLQKMEEDG